MRCGDLERYLEAFLDGRLGRSRSSVLRRHVALCSSCQARIERLRQFERDTQRRFRALEQPVSVWEGLELDLVGSGGAVGGRLLASRRSLVAGPDPGPREEPPRRRVLHHPMIAARLSARGGASRLVGLVLVAMALGATYQLARAGLEVEGGSDAAEAYLGFTQAGDEPTLRSDDRRKVGEWLASVLGQPVDVPSPPDGYRLVGASRASFADADAGAVVYAGGGGTSEVPVVLFVRLDPDKPSGAAADVLTSDHADVDLHDVSWQADKLRFTAVGPRPEVELRHFAP
jgi:anti-sigma factor RsiW